MKIMASGLITSWQIDREAMETVTDFIFLGSKITVYGDCSDEIKRHLLLGRKVMTNLDSMLKSRDIYFANKDLSSQSYGFSCGHVWMWELDYKESWEPKNWCFWTVVLEKTLESLDPTSPSQRKSVLNIHWKDWCWNSNTLVTWFKEPTLWKRPFAGEDGRQEEKGTTEDEIVGWHHRVNGHESE